MLRTAFLRSAGAARAAVCQVSRDAARRLPVLPSRAVGIQPLAARAAGWTSVRCYSSAGALKKEEVEGRIVTLLQGFYKVSASPLASPLRPPSYRAVLDVAIHGGPCVFWAYGS